MKVLLLNPNKYRPYIPPIGLEYICNSLDRATIPFEVIDLNFTSEAALYRKLSQNTFDLVGITIRNIDSTTLIFNEFFLPPIRKIIRRMKAIRPCKIVLGGSGFSHMPREILDYLGADFGIVGFGETALPQLIDALEHTRQLDAVPNLAWRKNGVFRINSLSNQAFAALPPRKRTFVRNQDYYRVYKMANIETRRGCNMTCGFCYEPHFVGHQVIAREVDSVIAEMKDLKRQGMTNLIFSDSEFNVGARSFIRDLCQRMLDEKLNITWTTSFYPERDFPLELFQLMYQAGCRELALSVDSGSNALLASMDKKHTAEDVVINSENIKKAKIGLMHYYLVGWPGESLATLDETLNLIIKTQPNMSLFFVGVRIPPHTKLAAIAQAEGSLAPDANLLKPIFYNSRQVLNEFFPYLRKRIRTIPNCVLPSKRRNFMHMLIHRAVLSGYNGIISDINRHIRNLPLRQQLALLANTLGDCLFPWRSLFPRE